MAAAMEVGPGMTLEVQRAATMDVDVLNSYMVRPTGEVGVDTSCPEAAFSHVVPFYSHTCEKFWLAHRQNGGITLKAHNWKTLHFSNLWQEPVVEGAWRNFPYPELINFPEVTESQADCVEALFQAFKQTKRWAALFLVSGALTDSKDVAAFGQRRGLTIPVDSDLVAHLRDLGASEEDLPVKAGMIVPQTGPPRPGWDDMSAKVMRGLIWVKFDLSNTGSGQLTAAMMFREFLAAEPDSLLLESTEKCAVWGDRQGGWDEKNQTEVPCGMNLLGKLLTAAGMCIQGKTEKDVFLDGEVSRAVASMHVHYERCFSDTPFVASFRMRTMEP